MDDCPRPGASIAESVDVRHHIMPQSALVGFGSAKLTVHANSVQLTSNLLSYCERTAFLDRCPDRIYTMTDEVAVCNTCDGVTCKD